MGASFSFKGDSEEKERTDDMRHRDVKRTQDIPRERGGAGLPTTSDHALDRGCQPQDPFPHHVSTEMGGKGGLFPTASVSPETAVPW